MGLVYGPRKGHFGLQESVGAEEDQMGRSNASIVARLTVSNVICLDICESSVEKWPTYCAPFVISYSSTKVLLLTISPESIREYVGRTVSPLFRCLERSVEHSDIFWSSMFLLIHMSTLCDHHLKIQLQ